MLTLPTYVAAGQEEASSETNTKQPLYIAVFTSPTINFDDQTNKHTD